MNKCISISAEIVLTAAFFAFAWLMSIIMSLPIVFPTSESAAFVGIHYLYPLIAIAGWAAIVLLLRKQKIGPEFFVALPCYALILLIHFNLKLWIPHVNPTLWDQQYWTIDIALQPVVLVCIKLRLALSTLIPLDSNFYMIGFIALFYLSFTYHAIKTPSRFRELVLAAMLLQIFGSLAYFVAPAIGPFIYQTGVEPPAHAAQQHMLHVWRANSSGGADWLSRNGGQQLTGGLAAMPSLHAGGSLLFIVFAWRYGRNLLWIMVPLFLFISIDAIANRWHYLVDLPVGWALTVLSAWCATVILRRSKARGIPGRNQEQQL